MTHFPSAISSECQEGSSDVNLKLKPHFSVLFRELYSVAPMWKEIGFFLDLDQKELNLIESDKGNSSRRLEGMLSLWLKQTDPSPIKSKIISVLKDLKLNEEAERLERKLQ